MPKLLAIFIERIDHYIPDNVYIANATGAATGLIDHKGDAGLILHGFNLAYRVGGTIPTGYPYVQNNTSFQTIGPVGGGTLWHNTHGHRKEIVFVYEDSIGAFQVERFPEENVGGTVQLPIDITFH